MTLLMPLRSGHAPVPALALVCSAACIYLPDNGALEGLEQGDVTGVAVGRLEGLQSDRDAPLQGVHVQLAGSIYRVTTNAQGRFTLRNIPEGNHLLTLTLGPRDRPLALAHVPFHMRAVRGQRAAINLGELGLVPPASITGTVDLQGQGSMEQVRVAALQGPGPGGTFADNGLATPDSAGTFVVDGLGPGTWRLMAVLGARAVTGAPLEVTAGEHRAGGTLVVPLDATPVPALARLTLRSAPNVSGPVPLTLDLVPAAAGLAPCGATLDFSPPGPAPVQLTGCNAGGPYVLSIVSDGTFLPYVNSNIILRDVEDLGDITLTRAEDCSECAVDAPDAGMGSSGNASSSSQGGISSSATGTSSGGASTSGASSSGVMASSGGSSSASAAGSSGSGSGSSGSGSSSGAVIPATVEPTVPGLTAFGSWVANGAGANPPVLSTPCVPGSVQSVRDCQHAGVFRKMVLPGALDCTTAVVTETDTLGATAALTWECRGGPTVEVVSTGFAPNKGLADLLDWSTQPPTFRNMILRVQIGGQTWESTPAQWWSDRVLDDPSGIQTTDFPGEPLVAALRSARTVDFTVDRADVSVTTEPGTRINLDMSVLGATAGASHLYLEGAFDGANSVQAIRLGDDPLSASEGLRLHALDSTTGVFIWRVLGVEATDILVTGTNQSTPLITIVQEAQHLDFRRVTLSGSNVYGLVIAGADARFQDVRVHSVSTGIQVQSMAATPLNPVTLQDVFIQDVNGDGLYVTSDDVHISNIQVAHASGYGVYAAFSSRMAVVGASIHNCSNGGMYLTSVNSGVFRNLVLAHNNSHGLFLETSSGVFLGEVTAYRNGLDNVSLNSVDNAVVSRVLTVGANVAGFHLDFSAVVAPSLFYDIASGENGTDVLIVASLPVSGTFDGELLLSTPSVCTVGASFTGLLDGCMVAVGSNVVINTIAGGLLTELLGPTGVINDAATLTTAHGWLHPQERTLVWGTDDGTAGVCLANCHEIDLAHALAAVDTRNRAWIAATDAAGHTYNNVVNNQDCAALGGTYVTSCTVTHSPAYYPASPDLTGNNGLCIPAMPCTPGSPCDCIEVRNFGAYQGEGTLTDNGPRSVASGTVNAFRWTTNGR